MGSNGILSEIEAALLNGESRENLNLKYNKSSVTRVFNKLKKADHFNNIEENKNISSSTNMNGDKEKQIEKLLKETLELLCNGKYEIDISINKKNKNINKVNVFNPFELYDKVKRDKFIELLKNKDREYLVQILKEYFKYNNKLLHKFNNLQMAEYICDEVENVMNIGKCFR